MQFRFWMRASDPPGGVSDVCLFYVKDNTGFRVMSRNILHDFLNIEDVIKRFMEFANLKSKGDVAQLFGIEPNSFSNKKKTAGLYQYFIKHGIKLNVNLNWLFTGEGERIIARPDEESEKTDELISAARRVLQSNTHYAESLASNIVSFDRGLDSEQNSMKRATGVDRKEGSIREGDPPGKKDELLKLRTV
jgi:hypothetical protein